MTTHTYMELPHPLPDWAPHTDAWELDASGKVRYYVRVTCVQRVHRGYLMARIHDRDLMTSSRNRFTNLVVLTHAPAAD